MTLKKEHSKKSYPAYNTNPIILFSSGIREEVPHSSEEQCCCRRVFLPASFYLFLSRSATI